MILLILITTIYFILLDELTLSLTQRRIGPFNVGYYGILSPIINGINLAITQSILTTNHLKLITIAFTFILSLYCFIFPFFIINSLFTLLVVIIINSIVHIIIVIGSISGSSKYSILGSIRLISQLVSFELVLMCLLLLYIIGLVNLDLMLL